MKQVIQKLSDPIVKQFADWLLKNAETHFYKWPSECAICVFLNEIHVTSNFKIYEDCNSVLLESDIGFYNITGAVLDIYCEISRNIYEKYSGNDVYELLKAYI